MPQSQQTHALTHYRKSVQDRAETLHTFRSNFVINNARNAQYHHTFIADVSSHAGGRRFESASLHQAKGIRTGLSPIVYLSFYLRRLKGVRTPLNLASRCIKMSSFLLLILVTVRRILHVLAKHVTKHKKTDHLG